VADLGQAGFGVLPGGRPQHAIGSECQSTCLVPGRLVAATLGFIVSLKENVERKKHSIDYLGSLTLTGGIVALLFALLQGGVTWAWTSFPSLGLFALAVVLIVLFLLQEARASEPILPLTLFTIRIITISSIGGVILGVVMFGITSYVPLFVQGVRGGTATSAGVTLGPLLLAWPIASTADTAVASAIAVNSTSTTRRSVRRQSTRRRSRTCG